MSYSYFRNSDPVTQYKLNASELIEDKNRQNYISSVERDMPFNKAEDKSIFYLNLSDGEISHTLIPYFPEGLPVLVLNESPCEYRRKDGTKFWILDSKYMSQTQITILAHLYKNFSTERFVTRYVLPNNNQYVRNIIEEVSDPPFILHGRDFAVNVKIVDQSEDWLLQGKTEPEISLPASPKKTTTPRRTTKKTATNKLELP